jgi:hypothetical protein
MIAYGGSVGIATDKGLDDRGSIHGKARDFSLLFSIQTASGAHLASWWVLRTLFSKGKRPEHEADHLPQSSSEPSMLEQCLHTLIRLSGVVLN